MRDEAGFTLIELLVAMVAASLLLGLLSWTIATLGRELARSRRSDRTAELVALAPVLRGLLEGASAGTDATRKFEGRPDGLSATVAPPQALGAIGPLRLHLDVRRDRGSEGLFASYTATSGQALPRSLTGPYALILGYRTIGLDYAPRNPGEQLGTPKLITIRFDAGDGDTSTISIAPMVSGTGPCRFDPISMTCRR